MSDIRTIYENLLRKYSDSVPETQNQSGKDIIKWLAQKGQLNSIIRNFAYSIYGICSDFGSHGNMELNKIYSPTPDTVNALVYALKDIILWIDKKIG